MPTITLNNLSVPFTPGSSVLEAARQNGVRIPTLCYHPILKSVGACRLCVVEVDGLRGFPTACTTPAADGMVVRTDTPALRSLRREVLSLILSEHPYTCLVCDRHDRCAEWQVTIRKAAVTTGCENCPKNGQCELQTLVDEVGLSLMPYSISYRGLPVEKKDPFFDRDYNLCILCGRCVRVCQDVRRTGTLAFIQRGSQTLVGTAFDKSHLEVDCEFCGSCVDVCPTGALYDKRSKWEGVPETTARTVCPYCSVGCELDLWIKRGKVVGVRPAGAVLPTGGLLTAPGGAAANTDGAPRNNGMACVRGRFGLVEMVHAPDRVRHPMLRKGGRLIETSWEDALAFLAEKLPAYRRESFALLASPHLTSESAYALQKFARQVMGSGNVDSPTALPRIPRIGELVDRLRAERSAPLRSLLDARSIVVIGANPRLSHPVAAVYIRQAQAAGARLIVVDPRRSELAKRADVWLPVKPGADAALLQELRQALARETIPGEPSNEQHALPQGGAPQGGAVALAAHCLKAASPCVILYGSGATHSLAAVETLDAIHDLAGDLQAGVIPLLGAANTLGVLDAGAVAVNEKQNYAGIVQGIANGEIKALYLAGEMPALDELMKLELLIVQDHFLSPNVAEYAHAVLPAASFAEVSGTLVNFEGRAQHFAPAIPPVGDTRPDWWIAAALARALGADGFAYSSAADVWQELDEQERPPVGQAASRPPSALDSQADYPFTLLLERNAYAYRSSALTDHIKGMELCKADEESLYLSVEDARRLAVAEGDLVQATSPAGSATFLAHLSADLPATLAYASINPAHGSQLFVGMLPGSKVCLVKIDKVTS